MERLTQMASEKINYKELAVKELKKLMGRDPKADAEFDRRISTGEIKTKSFTLEQIKELAEKSRQKAS